MTLQPNPPPSADPADFQSRGFLTPMAAVARQCRRLTAMLAAFFVSPHVLALPDHLTLVTSNPNTNAQVTLELDRYNLRAPNWQCRVYSSATNFTVLPSEQVPEPTTYRGRTSDGGMVWAAVRPTNLTMYTRVNYGTRWASAGNSDPYEGPDRYAWTRDIQLTGQTVHTGYVYQAAANSLVAVPVNQLPPANWYNNLGATHNFGGPPPYNNLWKMPVSLVRLVCSANQMSLAGTYQNSIPMALAAMESAVNETDVMAARDGGATFRIEASGVQTYPAGDVDTSANWGDLSGQFDIMCWVGNWGVSGGSFVISYPANMGADTWVHELGHSLGGPDFPHEHDYQGGLWDTCHVLNAPELAGIDLSGCIGGRSGSGYLKAGGFWYYRSPLPSRANPDFASTNINTPVDIDVLLNDWNVNTHDRADLLIESFQTPSEHGGTVTSLGGGYLRYTPASGFRGDDLFRYYVKDKSGNFKSLAGVRVLVADPNNPLIARYSFEETTGANVLDTSGASGGNRSGRIARGSFDTLHAAGLGSTNDYGAIRFTGVGGGPHLSFNKALDSAGTPDPQAGYCYDAMDRSQSVSLWYKPDALPGAGRQYLYLKDAALYDETAGFIMGIDNGIFFARVQMYGPYGNPVEVSANTGPNVLGVWYHVVGELDRENGQVHLFVNGQKFSSTAGGLPAGQFVVGPCPANMGAQTLWGYQGWRPAAAGSFDELRIYTKALTSAEVANLYEEPGLLPVCDPVPANIAVDIDLGPLLSWSPGRPRYQFDVYFGTDAAQVAAAGTGTPVIYQGRVNSARYQVPNILDPTRAYFWRVDVIDGATVGKGMVWQFTTGLPSPAKDILTFTWNGCVGLIDQTARTVALTTPFGTNVTALAPTVTLSRFASVSPASGSSRNFANPVSYTVTAQDGSMQTYLVTVYHAAQPGSILTLPPDLAPGASYRLVFVTSATTYSGGALGGYNTFTTGFTSVADYDAFASTRANAVSTLASLGTTWKALVSTGNPNSAAKTSTATDPVANAATSVPIYQLSGRRVADGYSDLWDGTIQNPINVTELGGLPPASTFDGKLRVWTGALADGGTPGATNALITQDGGYIQNGLADATHSGWVTGNVANEIHALPQPIYGISGVLTAPAAPELVTIHWGAYTGVIDQTARTVSLTVAYGTNLGTLNPTCTLTPGAVVSPDSGAVPNPSFASQNPQVYTVSAGALHTDYRVTVTVTTISTACDLLALNWGGYTATIDGASATLAIPNGTDITALNPTCTISPLATITPASGSTRNFTTPQSYTVTAQNGATSHTYMVRVIVKPVVVPPDLSSGARYRLVFVTSSKRDALAQDIATYNTFVANVAAGVPALNALGTTWKCIGSAGNRGTGVYINANENTLTRTTDPSVPIYRLDGVRVAGGNADLWDGSLATPISLTESGDTLNTKVWTGSLKSGVRNGDWFIGDTGGGWVYYGVSTGTGSGGVGSAWVDNLGESKGMAYAFYAISEILTAPVPSNSYAAWAAANAGGQAADLDSNHNGIPNGIEYFMGATAAHPATMPAVVNTNGVLTWTIPYDPAAAVSYRLQLSDNLSGWTDVAPPDARITVLTNTDRVRITLSTTTPRKFCRLVVTPAP